MLLLCGVPPWASANAQGVRPRPLNFLADFGAHPDTRSNGGRHRCAAISGRDTRLSELLDAQGKRIGRGSLEMTGYAAALRL